MCFSVYRVTTGRNRMKMNALYQESYFFLTLTHSSVLQWYALKCPFISFISFIFHRCSNGKSFKRCFKPIFKPCAFVLIT